MNNQTIIIIGAPRSGTNMLRDVLTSLPNVGTWPCDEINYIWRHGNLFFPSDAIPSDCARPSVVSYVRLKFDQMRDQQNVKVLVEKTCANSLRIPFVDKIIPEAKFLFIYRDGVDAVGSARLRWAADLDMTYLISKVRFVPISDLPAYGLRYFWSRLYRLFSFEKRLAFWGPKLPLMASILKKHSLNEICGLQWKQCVESSLETFADMDKSRYMSIKYEEFVVNPSLYLAQIADFIGLELKPEEVLTSVASVSAKSLGKGRDALNSSEIDTLQELIGDTLQKLGYE